MHTAILTLLFFSAIAVSANPAPASPLPQKKGNHTHHHHKEPTPTFRQRCQCQKPVIPVDLLSAGEGCLMRHAAAMGCYMGSKGACPSPAPACGLGPLKGIPLDQ